jgi:hypothetical protein
MLVYFHTKHGKPANPDYPEPCGTADRNDDGSINFQLPTIAPNTVFQIREEE